MPRSDESWTGRLRKIGDLERPDHHLLSEEDECYFMGSYTSGIGFGHSSTNDLIYNLKKGMEKRDTREWRYKQSAIREAGGALRQALDARFVETCTIVPIPPSKSPSSPKYDDRVPQIARLLCDEPDVREILLTVDEREARHLGQQRRDADQLRASIGVNPKFLYPVPQRVILLDDVLTTGCSFKVCKDMLTSIWPGVPIFGIFVARVARPTIDFGFACEI